MAPPNFFELEVLRSSEEVIERLMAPPNFFELEVLNS
jgi:hypothetical protein